MNPILNQNTFFVKEHVGFLKAANNYDVLDPETGQPIIECREDNLGFFAKMFRFTKYKIMTPFNIELKTPPGDKVLTVKRDTSFFGYKKVELLDENGQTIGYYKRKFSILKSSIHILNAQEEFMCQLKGNWVGWEFKFIKEDEEFAQVSKKWAGIGKALFTSADNYVLSINENVPENAPIRMMLLGAVMCIDMIIHEK